MISETNFLVARLNKFIQVINSFSVKMIVFLFLSSAYNLSAKNLNNVESGTIDFLAQNNTNSTFLVNQETSLFSGLDGWALSIDNDNLTPTGRDQDYTYGINLTLAGDRTNHYFLSSNSTLNHLNRKFGIGQLTANKSSSAIEFGVYAFTPEDIENPKPVVRDRPYASIIYSTTTQELNDPDPDVSWRTSLTFVYSG